MNGSSCWNASPHIGTHRDCLPYVGTRAGHLPSVQTTHWDTSGGLPSVHTAFHLRSNHWDTSRQPRPHLHSLGHAFALPVMCPHRLPCVDTTYHASTPPTTRRHRLPRVDTANQAFPLPPMRSSRPGTSDGGLTMGGHAAQPSSPAL